MQVYCITEDASVEKKEFDHMFVTELEAYEELDQYLHDELIGADIDVEDASRVCFELEDFDHSPSQDDIECANDHLFECEVNLNELKERSEEVKRWLEDNRVEEK